MQCGTLFKRLRRRQCGPKCRVILVRRRYYHRHITLHQPYHRGNTRYYTTLHNINITRYQQRTYHSVPTLLVGQDNTSWGSEDSEEKQAHQLSIHGPNEEYDTSKFKAIKNADGPNFKMQLKHFLRLLLLLVRQHCKTAGLSLS